MIHYHGTPITPRSELVPLAGKHFCVSFAAPQDADWCLANGQSVMWDNGAFNFYRQKIAADWTTLYAWLEPRLSHPHWAVVPDVIDGGVEANLRQMEKWPFAKSLASVVWHLDEPIEHLQYLVELGFGKVCFGSSGRYWRVGSDPWCQRIDEAFNALVATFGTLPWVHMLRGLAMAGDRWPFASADSVNVGRNFKDRDLDPERMARRIDAVQCPPFWIVRLQQGGLFS